MSDDATNEVFQEATEANDDVPMLSWANDQHGSQELLDRCALGLADRAEYQDCPFFRRFEYRHAGGGKMLFFPFATPEYKSRNGNSYNVFGCTDPPHAQRRHQLNAMRGCLVSETHDVAVDFTIGGSELRERQISIEF